MNDIIIEVNTATARTICEYSKIGVQHANLQNKLIFKMTEKIQGSAWLEYEINGQRKYAEMQEIQDGYQIDIRSCLLISDYVNVDLKITESAIADDIPIFVSEIIKLEVLKSINAVEEEPVEYPNWKTVADSKIAELNQLKTNLESSELERIENEETRKNQETSRENYINELKKDVNDGNFNGATFLPNLDDNGNLSWSNNKNLVNPETKNIRGPKGEKGDCNFATFKIVHGRLIMKKTKNLLVNFRLDGNRLKVVI